MYLSLIFLCWSPWCIIYTSISGSMDIEPRTEGNPLSVAHTVCVFKGIINQSWQQIQIQNTNPNTNGNNATKLAQRCQSFNILGIVFLLQISLLTINISWSIFLFKMIGFTYMPTTRIMPQKYSGLKVSSCHLVVSWSHPYGLILIVSYSSYHPHGLVLMVSSSWSDSHGLIVMVSSSWSHPHGLILIVSSSSSHPHGLILIV